MAPPPIRCAPMATALTGVHFAHPTAATRARSCESRTAAAAPLTPTAPISDPPNHAAAPRSCRERTIVFREDMKILDIRMRRERRTATTANLGSAGAGRDLNEHEGSRGENARSERFETLRCLPVATPLLRGTASPWRSRRTVHVSDAETEYWLTWFLVMCEGRE